MKQTILNIGILLACMISCVMPLKANNPYLNALKLHGDVSCVKIYWQEWTTKFGEIVLDDNKDLGATLYYDQNHRLLYVDSWNSSYYYFYEYTYKDDALTTIDCYEYLNGHTHLERKIKLTKENGITVAYVYNSSGDEIGKHSPYNAIESNNNRTSVEFWDPVPNDGLDYFNIFAFEIKATEPIYRPYYKYKYNSKKQLSSMFNSGNHIKFDYDDKGNLTCIKNNFDPGDRNSDGVIYTFEYEYGNFEESEKFRMTNYVNRIKQEDARRDSIAAAEIQAREDSIINAEKQEEDSIINAEKQEWEEKILPAIKEFAKAMKDYSPENKSFKAILKKAFLNPKVDVMIGNEFYIMFDDNSRTQIPRIKHEYSDDSGNYNVYYNDDLTCMIFRPRSGKKGYIVRKLSSGSFIVYTHDSI